MRRQNCEERLFASLCVSGRLSVHLELIGTHWTDFQEISYLRIFKKYVEKIQVSLKSEKKITIPLHEDTYIYDNIQLNSSRVRFQANVVQKIKTRILS